MACVELNVLPFFWTNSYACLNDGFAFDWLYARDGF